MAVFREGIEQMAFALRQGQTVLLHCAAGIGRTGTAAACLLKHLGTDSAQAVKRVSDAGSNPQNAVQSGLVDRF
jgi:protein-tyrosine phosphatase